MPAQHLSLVLFFWDFIICWLRQLNVTGIGDNEAPAYKSRWLRRKTLQNVDFFWATIRGNASLGLPLTTRHRLKGEMNFFFPLYYRKNAKHAYPITTTTNQIGGSFQFEHAITTACRGIHLSKAKHAKHWTSVTEHCWYCVMTAKQALQRRKQTIWNKWNLNLQVFKKSSDWSKQSQQHVMVVFDWICHHKGSLRLSCM